MKNIIFLTLLFLFQNADAQDDKTSYEDAFNLIDGWLDAYKDYHHLPGLSVAVAKDQKTLWSHAYGYSNVADGIPASSSTIYSICSISKLFTSIAIMQLYEQGKLRLDDEITSLLPDFNLKQQFKDSGPITIRSLLTHSSGLPRESDYPYWSNNDLFPTSAQVEAKWKDQQTLYPASTHLQYSNLGLTVLGMVVEKVSGKKYEVYVEENIIKPLQLNDTYPYLPQDEWGKKMATGYSTLTREGKREPMAQFDARGITSAAGFASNVEDLAKFASWNFRLLNDGEKEVLLSSTLKEMQRVHWTEMNRETPEGSTWGLGFEVTKRDDYWVVGHGGWCPGYRTSLQMFPNEKLGVTVMINAVGESPSSVAREIRDIVASVPKDQATATKSIALGKYAGTYINSELFQMLVVPWYGDLAVLDLPSENPDKDIILLRHISGDTFRRIANDKTLTEEWKFESDRNGKVIRVWVHSNYSDKIK